MSDPRPAIIFLHIPKTAGSTLREVLRAHFDKRNIYDQPAGSDEGRRARGDAPLPPERRAKPTVNANRGTIARLRGLGLDRVASFDLLMGHFWFGLHEALPRPATYITFLRDPVPRVLSLYGHRSRHQGLNEGMSEYLRTVKDFAIDNEQTRRIVGRIDGGDIRRDKVTPDMLDEAKRNLESHFAPPGIVERFDESLVVLARALGWADVSYRSVNVSKRPARRDDLDPALVERILERNTFDTELYRHADARLSDSWARDPSLASDLDALSAANANLATATPKLRDRIDGIDTQRAIRAAGRRARALRRRLRPKR